MPPQSEPATWPGSTRTVSGQRRKPAQRLEEVLCALARGDREVRPCRVADEQRVAGEHQLVVDEEGAVLRPVAGRVQHGDAHRADLDDLAVLERLELERRLGERMDGDGQAVLEREAPVPRDVVGVGVGLEHALDPHAGLAGSRDDRLDLQRRVDDDRDACVGVADQVAGAAEILVHELPKEQHE